MTDLEFKKQNFNSKTKVTYKNKEYLVLGVSFKRGIEVEGVSSENYIAIDLNDDPYMLTWIPCTEIEIVKKTK